MKIEIDSDRNEIALDGARVSIEALCSIANPDCRRFYRFHRIGETIFLKSYAIAKDAELDTSEIIGGGR
jgi:hypothetical protein